MRRINTSDGLYRNADPMAGQQGTIVTAEALNAIQEEIASVITAAGIALNPEDDRQLLKAIIAFTGQLGITHDTTNVSPVDGSFGESATPLLIGSTYYPLYDVPQASRHFQVKRETDTWDVLLYEGTATPVGETSASSHRLSLPLPADSSFEWRYRDMNLLGEFSKWSSAARFTTSMTYIVAPTIIGPADGATNVGAQPVVQLSAFAVVGGADAQASTSVRIKDSAGAVVWELIDSASPLNNIVVPSGVLQPGNKIYTIEGRHRGAVYGSSQWSAPVTITTLSEFLPDFNASVGMAFGGGFIAGQIKSDYDGHTYGLIVSTAGGDSNLTGTGIVNWYQGGGGQPAKYTVAPVAGTPPSMLSDGLVNYQAMPLNTTGGVKKWVEDRCNAGTGLNGYKDWYIPARDELNLIYRNFKPSFNLNEVSNRAGNANQVGADGLPHGTNAQAVPALGGHTMYVPARTPISPFQEGATQGLTPNTDYGYWSSTFAGSVDGSTNAPAAWTENFGGGGQKPTGVNQSVYVRVVRRVKISD